jgi:hypothetical protein
MTGAARLVTLVKKARTLATGSNRCEPARGAWPLAGKEKEVNPIWTKMIIDAVENTTKTCPHCKKVATYTRKRPGQFHKCKRCGHRFKENG